MAIFIQEFNFVNKDVIIKIDNNFCVVFLEIVFQTCISGLILL